MIRPIGLMKSLSRTELESLNSNKLNQVTSSQPLDVEESSQPLFFMSFKNTSAQSNKQATI